MLEYFYGKYLAQAIFERNLFPYKYYNILNPSHSSYLSAYEDGTVSVPKRRHIKFKRQGIIHKKAHYFLMLAIRKCLTHI